MSLGWEEPQSGASVHPMLCKTPPRGVGSLPQGEMRPRVPRASIFSWCKQEVTGFSLTPLMLYLFSACLKDPSLQGELTKDKKGIEAMEGKKQRLASVTSSESFASSGFQEDKSLSDEEEDEEGRY